MLTLWISFVKHVSFIVALMELGLLDGCVDGGFGRSWMLEHGLSKCGARFTLLCPSSVQAPYDEIMS